MSKHKYTDDHLENCKTIRGYFNYLYLVFTRDPAVARDFAATIKNWKEKKDD